MRIRVALMADTHGHLDPRIAELVRHCDLAVHAGDIGNAEVLDQLQPRSGKVVAIRGNNDVPAKWPASDHGRLAELEWEVGLDLPGGTLVAVHGHRCRSARQRHEILRAHYPEARAVVYGHSHRLTCDQSAATWILNPGAAGYSRTYGGPSCLVLDTGPRSWKLEAHRFDPLPRS